MRNSTSSCAEHVVKSLKQQGYEAVAPMLLPQWQTKDSDRFVFSSMWSERHAAYAAGLGTFGLCDGLITPKGKAMRVGSVVARIPIPPTVRPYTDHHAYCLYFTAGTCRKCVERCPVGAITDARARQARVQPAPQADDGELCESQLWL